MYFDTVLRRQFGRPSGLVGSVLMRPLLNVANQRLLRASLELLEVRPRDGMLDVGFGGGYSLFSWPRWRPVDGLSESTVLPRW